MHDLKRIAKDATGILAPDFYVEARVGRENHRGECVRALSYWASRNERADELLKRLAAFARDLLDETPLTAERLVERGYVHDAIRWPGCPDVPCLRRGKLYVYSTGHADPRNWSWEHDDDGPSIWPVPRTVGDLAMIEHLMEGR